MQGIREVGIYVDANGTVVLCGGFNTIMMRPELRSIMIDTTNERIIDMV